MFKIQSLDLTFFLAVIITICTATSPLIQMCIYFVRDVCHPCNQSDHGAERCAEIRNDMKIISFEKNVTKIDYESYVNSNIKIIKIGEKQTLYMCDSRDAYMHVRAPDYYPLDRKLHYPFVYVHPGVVKLYTPFQECIHNHCLGKSNQFQCSIGFVTDLDFTFNKHVTPKFIQNITSANILAFGMKSLSTNNFFQYACNLIYLDLKMPNLDYFSCYVFETLENLRLLSFAYIKFPIEHYKCIFLYNKNLVRIEAGSFKFWNTCDDNDVTKSNAPTTITMSNIVEYDDNNVITPFDPFF